LIKSFVVSYPSFDYVTNEVTIRTYLNVLEASGFFINSIGLFNEDTTPLMTDETTFTGDSKSQTDEFTFIIKNRLL